MNKEIKTECIFFKGDIPCNHHKNEGAHCSECKYFQPIETKILIIKLGATGDVIRTTPILRKLQVTYSNAQITWLTYFPELVPNCVDNILKFELKNILPLISTKFDILYNLDKDKEACALTKMINARVKKGFTLNEGKCAPIDEDAQHKWRSGLFDDFNRANNKSYVEEIFEICGFSYNGERYIIDRPKKNFIWNLLEPRPLIGLNTGCGNRWPTRLWDEKNWITLAKLLKKEGYGVIFLGGKKEHEKNKRLSKEATASYLGYYPLKKFISLIDHCDLIITSVTMALHIAIGLDKNVILFNNIFNKNEFDLYGLGEIIEPDVECKGCYKKHCERNCMSLIDPDGVFNICKIITNL